MKIPTLFREYIWLIETIYRAHKITFAEINKKWREAGYYIISMKNDFKTIYGDGVQKVDFTFPVEKQ